MEIDKEKIFKAITSFGSLCSAYDAIDKSIKLDHIELTELKYIIEKYN